MSTLEQAQGGHDLNEGSWAYLSLGERDDDARRTLRQSLIEACEESGWPAISWSRSTNPAHDPDHSRFFDGMSHAVAHADVVITLMDSKTAISDAELIFAYRHRRPVIGLCLSSRGSELTAVKTMLREYQRAQVVDCDGIADCARALREALGNQEFAATIREATMEPTSHA